MRVLFMGTPDFAASSLREIIAAGHEVIGVVTQPDRIRGRGQTVHFSPVKEEALKHNIPVFQPRRIRDEEEIEKLSALQPDVGAVVAFGQILPREILDLPKYGCLNAHASILPAYRGAAPIQWAIIDGLEVTGVTIIQMNEGLDTGDILARKTVAIDPDETGGSLSEKLAEAGARLLTDTLRLVERGETDPEPQGETTTEYARMLTKRMGRIDWTDSAERIERLVRGLSPWPSAYTTLNDKNFKIWKSAVTRELPEADFNRDAYFTPDPIPGEPALITKDAAIIKTGDGYLSLLEVQLEGKKQMEIRDFLRGIHKFVLK